MKITRLVAILMLILAGAAQAQSLRRDSGPKEFPPASYKGKQYVDSAGCVYIRAGIDGSVSWVPRVSRNRKVVCGFQPSLQASATVAAPVVTPVPAPERITVAAPSQKPVARPAPRIARATPVRRATVAQPVAVAAAPAPVAAQTVIAPRKSKAASIPPNARVVPRHVYQARQQNGHFTVPEGYRSVWEDDRLNPRRAEHTLAGNAQTAQIWTDTVPRRLIKAGKSDVLKGRTAVVYVYSNPPQPGVTYSTRSGIAQTSRQKSGASR